MVVTVGATDPYWQQKKIGDLTKIAMQAVQFAQDKKEKTQARMQRTMEDIRKTAEKDPQLALKMMERAESKYGKKMGDLNPLKDLLGGRADDMQTETDAWKQSMENFSTNLEEYAELDKQLAQREQQWQQAMQFDPGQAMTAQAALQDIQKERQQLQQRMRPENIWNESVAALGEQRPLAESYAQRVGLGGLFQKMGATDWTKLPANIQAARAHGLDAVEATEIAIGTKVKPALLTELEERKKKEEWIQNLRQRHKLEGYEEQQRLDIEEHKKKAETDVWKAGESEEAKLKKREEYGTLPGQVSKKKGAKELDEENWGTEYWKEYKTSAKRTKQELEAEVRHIRRQDPSLSRDEALEKMRSEERDTGVIEEIPDSYQSEITDMVKKIPADLSPQERYETLHNYAQLYNDLIVGRGFSPEKAMDIIRKLNAGEIEAPPEMEPP